MTVCIASDGFPPKAGGIVSFNWHITQLLLNAGHSVVQINIDRAPDANDRVVTKRGFTQVWLAKTFQAYKKTWAAYFRPGGMDAPDWIATGLAMKDWLLAHSKSFGIDIVEASDFGGYGAFLSAPELPPLILTGHASILQLSRVNFYPEKEESYQLLRQLEKTAYENAAAIITHSARNANDLRGFTKVPVLESPMPWTPIETKKNSDRQTSVQMVGIGALQPAKGILVLAKALQLLKQKGLPVNVTWIGDDTFHSPDIYSLADYLQEKYPDIWGTYFTWKQGEPHPAVLQYMNMAEIVILPSLFETFGYIVLEAASLGKAVIMSDKVGAAQHFKNGTSAMITTAGNEEELAEAIEKLCLDKERRKKMGLEAANELAAQFNPFAIIDSRVAIYKTVIKNAPKQPGGLSAALQIIKPYKTRKRKAYYRLRAYAKAILKANKSK